MSSDNLKKLPMSSQRLSKRKSDPQIIEELIADRFSDFFKEYKLKRRNRKSYRMEDIVEESDEESFVSNLNIGSISASESASTNEESFYVEDKNTLKPCEVENEVKMSWIDEKLSLDSFEISNLGNFNEEFDFNHLQNVIRLLDDEDETPERDLSDILSKYTSDIHCYPTCNTLTKRSKNEVIYESTRHLTTTDLLGSLLSEKNIQNQIVQQTSKALVFCRNTKEFNGSFEEVEVERFLLLASVKREAILQEIAKIEKQNTNEPETKNPGSIYFKKLQLPVIINVDLDKQKKKNNEIWFVCVVNMGSKVFGTHPQMPSNNELVFLMDFQFEGLSPDVEIVVAVYQIKIRNKSKIYSHNSKFHINKSCKSFTLPRKKKEKALKSLNECCKSSFSLFGKLVLNVNNIHDKTYKLDGILNGKAELTVESSVQINEKFGEFVDVGKRNGGYIIWNRLWCILEGQNMVYFNYPEEETPVEVLDLMRAKGAVTQVSRNLCSRPRTLLIEFVDADHQFLASESVQKMQRLERKLNSAIEALRLWIA